MANRLKMAKVHSILTLRERGWSQRAIARALGIDRGTVLRHLRAARAANAANAPPGPDAADTAANAVSGGSNAANAPTGSDGVNTAQATIGAEAADGAWAVGANVSNAAHAPIGSGGRTSDCEPYRAFIQDKLEQGLSARRIHQDLTVELSAAVSYTSVRRFVQRLVQRAPAPFRRMESPPGAEAQIDFGTGAPIITAEGQRRRTHVFRIVLSHSRKAYSEVVFRQTADDFIRCLENAFHHFGGVPKTLVIDNLKAGVIKADWFDPELNPRLAACAAHYGTVVLPTRPYTPRHKGKVERGVDYVQENALKGKSFTSLAEQNQHLRGWESQVADTRIHGTTRQQVKQAFEREQPALLPLPAERFPIFTEARRKVSRDGHVEVAKAYYSAPPEYVGREVWARWDSRTVRIYNTRFEQIAMHVRHEPGRFSTEPGHIPQNKRSSIERGATYLLGKASLIGPHAGEWAAQMVQQRGIEGTRVLQGLLSLTQRHSAEQIEQACEVATTHGAYRLQSVRELLNRQAPRQERFEFIEEHPIIRSLSEYGDLVHAAFTQES
jgi:transposase